MTVFFSLTKKKKKGKETVLAAGNEKGYKAENVQNFVLKNGIGTVKKCAKSGP